MIHPPWIKVGSRLDHKGYFGAKWKVSYMVLAGNERYKELNSHQKAGLITVLLMGGSEITTDGIARIVGLTWDGAEYMMNMLSAVLPILKIDGKWRWLEDKEGL